ncbi:hypothetical protein JCM21738_1399 [Mesobacillus boroniphilus JCM 21738]|uniref:Uncharacterized protein n=1 Tax=Mesobacillus boroniphilus JCM 21738 TaxID=1294265 RepID=W4RM48_9BACI|nr:hypothetical protein JCM21738_1399 [Mesobacillus boroniphilus JCM 21738]
MIINIILFGMVVYYLIYTIMRKYRISFLTIVKKWEIKNKERKTQWVVPFLIFS